MDMGIQLIYEEALRKYNNIREIADGHDSKAATILGFIVRRTNLYDSIIFFQLLRPVDEKNLYRRKNRRSYFSV